MGKGWWEKVVMTIEKFAIKEKARSRLIQFITKPWRFRWTG